MRIIYTDDDNPMAIPVNKIDCLKLIKMNSGTSIVNIVCGDKHISDHFDTIDEGRARFDYICGLIESL